MKPGDLLVPNRRWNANLHKSADSVVEPIRRTYSIETPWAGEPQKTEETVLLLAIVPKQKHASYDHLVLACDGTYYIDDSCWKRIDQVYSW